MYLHIGASVVVNLNQVVAIIDLRSASVEALLGSEPQPSVIDIAEGEAKSLVITDSQLFLSPISSLTLKRRSAQLTEGLATELS